MTVMLYLNKLGLRTFGGTVTDNISALTFVFLMLLGIVALNSSLTMKILSWNVNGIRSVQRKGFLEWLERESPDVLCVQETKAHQEQLDPALIQPKGYYAYFCSGVRKGYSGVATFTKEKPISARTGFGIPLFDQEGRVLITEYPEFTLLNIYFPNGKQSEERLRYKLDFYEETLKFVGHLKSQGKRLVVCGDYNTAHKPIDLTRPKENEKVSGFFPLKHTFF